MISAVVDRGVIELRGLVDEFGGVTLPFNRAKVQVTKKKNLQVDLLRWHRSSLPNEEMMLRNNHVYPLVQEGEVTKIECPGMLRQAGIRLSEPERTRLSVIWRPDDRKLLLIFPQLKSV